MASSTAQSPVIIKTSEPFIEQALAVYERGGVVICPSTTNYILTCDATNESAVNRIFEIKRRNRQSGPLCVALPDVDALPAYAKLPQNFPQQAVSELLPGEIVFIFNSNYDFPKQLMCGLPTVGITVSPDKDFGRLAKAYGKPLAGTSANISGQGNIFVSLEKALLDIGNDVDLVLDGGPTLAQSFIDHKDRANTIVDFTYGAPWLVRKGFVATDRVLKVFPNLNTDTDAYKERLQQALSKTAA